MSSSLSCDANSGWKMRNSFFINHTFRMLFHVLNIFDYFHIEHYIMKQISTESRTHTYTHIQFVQLHREWDIIFKDRERKREIEMEEIFFLLNHSVASWNCFCAISPIQIENNRIVIVYQHCCSRLSLLQSWHERKKNVHLSLGRDINQIENENENWKIIKRSVDWFERHGK